MRFKHLLLILLLILTVVPAMQSQERQRRDFDVEKFKKQRADFIISEADLTDAEAKAFIPLVNELLDKRFELHRDLRANNRTPRERNNWTNADYERVIEAEFDSRAKELQLDKEYYLKFKKVLPLEKIYKYQKAENKFMRTVVDRDRGKNGTTRSTQK
jgi:hypothetical protein